MKKKDNIYILFSLVFVEIISLPRPRIGVLREVFLILANHLASTDN